LSRVLRFGNTSIPLDGPGEDVASNRQRGAAIDGLVQLGPTAVQFIKNFRSNNYATFDATPLRVPVHWCGNLGLATIAPFMTLDIKDKHLTSCNKVDSLKDLLTQVVGTMRADSGGVTIDEELADYSFYRVWGLYPDEVTRASTTSSKWDTTYTRLPDRFAQSTLQGGGSCSPVMSHTKDTVWRLLTVQSADYDTALLSLCSRPGGGGCLALMLESCCFTSTGGQDGVSPSSEGGARLSCAERRWPSDRILGNQQLVRQATTFKISDSIDVLDGSNRWVCGEVSLIDRVQSPDPARVMLVISVRVPATATTEQQVIQLLESSPRVLRLGTITALLLSSDDRCNRYLHEHAPSLHIATLLIGAYLTAGLQLIPGDTRSTQTIIDLYGLTAREVYLLSRALVRGPSDKSTTLKLLHLLVLTDGLHLLDSQFSRCTAVTSEERAGIYGSTAWPRLISQLHQLNKSVDPALALKSHLLGLRKRDEEQRIIAAKRMDADRSTISRVSNYFSVARHNRGGGAPRSQHSLMALVPKKRLHTSRVSAVTVDSAADQSTTGESPVSSSSVHSQHRSGPDTAAHQFTQQQYVKPEDLRDDVHVNSSLHATNSPAGVSSLIGVAGTYCTVRVK